MHVFRCASLTAAAALAASLGACGGGGASSAGPSRPAAASGPALVEVPRLVGRRQDDAHRIAARAGLRLRWTGFTGQYGNGRYDIGCVKVLRQSPAPGERRPRGAQVFVIETGCRTSRAHPHVL
jgi:PASTA domain